jgi:hypothetical protein
MWSRSPVVSAAGHREIPGQLAQVGLSKRLRSDVHRDPIATSPPAGQKPSTAVQGSPVSPISRHRLSQPKPSRPTVEHPAFPICHDHEHRIIVLMPSPQRVGILAPMSQVIAGAVRSHTESGFGRPLRIGPPAWTLADSGTGIDSVTGFATRYRLSFKQGLSPAFRACVSRWNPRSGFVWGSLIITMHRHVDLKHEGYRFAIEIRQRCNQLKQTSNMVRTR